MSKCETRNITVVATEDTNELSGVSFNMYENGQNLNHRIVSEKTNGMRKGDHHEVVFTLDDRTGLGLRFASDPNMAMWVKRGWLGMTPHCPRSPKSHRHIPPHRVAPTELEVHNLNPIRSKYKFALNFVREGNPRLISYDPIWENRNGGVD